jgi:hypothetical protein
MFVGHDPADTVAEIQEVSLLQHTDTGTPDIVTTWEWRRSVGTLSTLLDRSLPGGGISY